MKRYKSFQDSDESQAEAPGSSSRKTSVQRKTSSPTKSNGVAQKASKTVKSTNSNSTNSSSTSANRSTLSSYNIKTSSSGSTKKPAQPVGPGKGQKIQPGSSMPPTGDSIKAEVENIIAENDIVVFSKTHCPFCKKAKDLLKTLSVKFETVELDVIERGSAYQDALKTLTGQSTVPNIFIHGKHLGGCDSLLTAHGNSSLADMIHNKADIQKFDYDLVVIGGGSGGLAAAKEAAQLGRKVALFDFVKPSPLGTTWGLGGTCVNVGCIPKKLMHRASILGEDLHDAKAFGWELPEKVSHNWDTMRNAIQDHIGSLNWGYRVQLRDKKVNYVNAFAEIVDKHTIKATKKNKSEVTMTAGNIILATGERPRYLDILGAQEHTVTSDDLFSLPYCPGKTLCVGASYVSLECAGFLAGIGLDTTVMVRSILLRGFDQQCAEMIGGYMEKHGVKFVRGAVPTKIEQLEKGQPGRYRVTAKCTDGSQIVEEYNTILVAVGRDPCTKGIGIENVQVKLHDKTNRVLVDAEERTNVPNVYAIGDIGEGRPELTPVAIQAGRLLSRRMFEEGFNKTMDYKNIATTVFTPLEYGCIGYSEEDAVKKFGEDNIEIYHSYYMPLEWTVPHREENTCYAKLVCDKTDQERVIGFHVLGPNAGEITQGFAVAMKRGAVKDDFDSTVGIHPTSAEIFTTLQVTKRSGASAEVTGC